MTTSSGVEIQVVEEVDQQEWDAGLSALPFARFEDSIQRQQSILDRWPDMRPRFLLAYGDGEVAGKLGFCRTYFGHDLAQADRRFSLLSPLLRRTMKTYDYPTTPLIYRKDLESEIINGFLDTLEDLAKRERLYSVSHLRYPSPGLAAVAGREAFLDRGYSIWTHGTYLIDLGIGEEGLWAGLKSGTRTAVRRSQKQGIEVRLGGVEDLERYYDIIAENRRRDQRQNIYRPIYAKERMLPYLEFLITSGLSQMFCAGIDGQVDSCTLVQRFGRVASFGLHARSDSFHEARLADGDALCWKMISWAAESGYGTFDMTGFDSVPQNDRQRGIRRFKSKWGGQMHEYDYYTKVHGKLRERAVQVAKRVLRRS